MPTTPQRPSASRAAAPRLGALLLTLAVAACGDAPTPTAPDALRTSAAQGRAPHVVVVTPGTAELIATQTVQLAAELRNRGGEIVHGRPAVAWTTSDPAIATVDAEGRVTTHAAGEVRIVATFVEWGRSGAATLVVRPQTLRAWADRRGLDVGVAVGYTATTFPANAPYTALLGREFNLLVPENVMKWQTLRRDGPTSWRFQFTDQMLDHAEANGMRVRGHPLAWHAGNPGWLTALTPQTTTRAQGIALLEEHVTAVVSRYRGRIRDYDVANEVIADGGSGGRRSAAQSVWERIIGPDWVDVAFRAAAAADPQARLFYNDYSIETLNAKQTGVYELVRGLQARGVPIHGVGFQSHFIHGSVPTDAQLRASMDRFAALGLEVQITELDIRIANPVTPAKLAAQADEYRRVVRACDEHPACRTVVFWGLDDGNSWIPSTFPGFGAAHLFDAAFAPKPAYYGVLDYLAGRVM